MKEFLFANRQHEQTYIQATKLLLLLATVILQNIKT